jgi:hypothetical protein
MIYSERHSGPRSKLEAAFVCAFLAAWLLVFGLVLGQALLHYGYQIILTLRGRI